MSDKKLIHKTLHVHSGPCLIVLTGLILLMVATSCGIGVKYSMTGYSTTAKTLTINEFYNNTDLGPANLGPNFTNTLKNYLISNSSLSVVPEEGELQFDGEITDFRLTPIAPVSTGDPNQMTQASSQRLTIVVKVTYVNTLDDAMSFKDKSFSFYQDFPNEQNLTDVQDRLTRVIFDRIVNDIFNASVANW